MARDKASKVDTAGKKPGLGHNPFGALAALASELPPGVARDGSPSPIADAPKHGKGKLVLRRETKHRGGKPVVVVVGFESVDGLSPQGVAQLAQELKRTLACGGTCETAEEGQRIVLQGDDPARVASLLVARGYRVTGTIR